MDNLLCSDNFQRFFNNIENANVPINELAKIISKELSVLAPDISLGRSLTVFVSPPMPYNRDGTSIETQLFLSPDGFEPDEVRCEFVTGDNGKATIISCPAKGHTWTDDEKQEIRFLHKCMFVIFGRTRLNGIIRTTLSSDAMTGLPNVMGFSAIGDTLRKQNRLHLYTAMFINIKNFRCVNSQVGSRRGDEVLKQYAARIQSALDDDEYIARPGGDNFTLLVKKENSKKITELLSDVPVELPLDGSSIQFSMAARIGMYDIEEGDVMSHVMHCISIAVNSARRSAAVDTVICTPDIMRKIERENTLTSLFADAIENHEFIVYYQPKVDILSSAMCGCEALVRWKRGDNLVSPAEFIPVFERDGNICTLDFYMLETVCRDIERWTKMGLEPVTVSVNFSKTNLHDPHLAEHIMEIIRRYNIETKYIEVEMTEMSDFNDYNAFKTLVSKMKENGVVTSIDDFGTGYSSLNLLTDFMFDVVKLDKSFLDNISRSGSKTDEIVVRNILNMIRELGMKAIAEGVETAEQAKLLKSMGCTMVQGYLYDRPLCVDDFLKRLENKQYENKI